MKTALWRSAISGSREVSVEFRQHIFTNIQRNSS